MHALIRHRWSSCLVRVVLLWLGIWSGVFAQVSVPSSGAALPGLMASAATPSVGEETHPLVVFNREIAIFRGTFLGTTPGERARRAQWAIDEQLTRLTQGVVTINKVPQGRVLMIDGEMAFLLVPDDVDMARHETLDKAAAKAKFQIEQMIAETRESRDGSRLWHGVIAATIASLVFFALFALVLRGRNLLSTKLVWLVGKITGSLQIAGVQLLQRDRLAAATRFAVRLFSWAVLALLTYQWLSYVLSKFPYTRPWGEQLSDYLFQVAEHIGTSMLHALPDLFVAVVIFAIGRGVNNMLATLFDRIESGDVVWGWLDRDTVRPTRRIVSIGVWLFALVMAYPYLPGSGSEAFKGVSVLLGLMISLGSSSVVGQGASGMILMFSRTIRVGEYVRIADHEGTVTELGMFTTRIRTGLGEELTLPNSVVLGTVTKNYSRTVKGPGFIVDTTVTIGYDTAWRQVEAMLVEGARRTPGVLNHPAPVVFQTALSDFYPEYRLVCQAIPAQPRPRAEVLSNLHANIQDVFNEYGVQIMSPHYLGDPAQAKFVPKSAWFPAPAKPE